MLITLISQRNRWILTVVTIILIIVVNDGAPEKRDRGKDADNRGDNAVSEICNEIF